MVLSISDVALCPSVWEMSVSQNVCSQNEESRAVRETEKVPITLELQGVYKYIEVNLAQNLSAR